MRASFLGFLLASAAACQTPPAGSVRIAILAADGPDPFVGAVTVRLRIEPGGPSSSWPYVPGERIDVSLAIDADGEQHQLTIEAVAEDGRIVGRGTSPPVTLAEGAVAELEVVPRAVGQSSSTLEMLVAPRIEHAVATVPGLGVCLVGGRAYGVHVKEVECFDPWLTQQFEAPPLPEGRRAPVALVTSDNAILVLGGERDDAAVLTPLATAWTVVGSVPVDGAAAAAIGLDAWIVAGAALGQPASSATREVTWTSGALAVTDGPALSEPRDRPTATALAGDVLIVGGSDTRFGEWLSGAAVDGPGIRQHAAVAVGDVVVIVGGGSRIASVSKAGGRAVEGSLSHARAAPGAEALPDGRVLVVGGSGGADAPRTAEVVARMDGVWTSTDTIPLMRSHVGLKTGVLAGGAILTVGGVAANGGLTPDGEVFVP